MKLTLCARWCPRCSDIQMNDMYFLPVLNGQSMFAWVQLELKQYLNLLGKDTNGLR